ncbi:MAG: Reverse transcriptase (RNA-dependent DNA polymerase) [Candidatus Latescibacteria bacterium ADurb.Bin168]|jgi:retron-type reverse transcriptase|nr:MAG: Reverse transcriptase (RNA-dependent DNA polymerase) [Candidatus Latescibacteria bacterium ADurb.Bin168]
MPKTVNGLWGGMITFAALHAAYMEARKSKRYSSEVLEFGQRLEENLIVLQNRLLWHEWRPGPWRIFSIREPKLRIIHAPPFADRVVHHALVAAIRPPLERKMIEDSYACRAGKGTHRAMLRVLEMSRELHKTGRGYALHTDVSKYFPSINHEALLGILRRTIRDRNVLWLCEKIIKDNGFDGRGLPIGALTSQLFANVYLDQLDHYVKDGLGVKRYVRYMDDTVTLMGNKKSLWELRAEIETFLRDRLDLRLNPKTAVYPIAQGIDFCGYRTWPHRVLPRKRNLRKARKRLSGLARLVATGQVAAGVLRQSLASLRGYLKWCTCRMPVSAGVDEGGA